MRFIVLIGFLLLSNLVICPDSLAQFISSEHRKEFNNRLQHELDSLNNGMQVEGITGNGTKYWLITKGGIIYESSSKSFHWKKIATFPIDSTLSKQRFSEFYGLEFVSGTFYVQRCYLDWKSRPMRWRYLLYASYDKGKTWQMLFDKPNVWQVILQKVEQKKLFITVNALDTVKERYYNYLHIADMLSYWVSQDKGKTWQKRQYDDEITTEYQVKIGRYTIRSNENSIRRATNKFDSQIVLNAEKCDCEYECDDGNPRYGWIFGYCKVDSSLLTFTRRNCSYITNGIYRSVDSGSTWRKVYDANFIDYRSYIVSDSIVFCGTSNKGLLVSYTQGETWLQVPEVFLKVNVLRRIGDKIFIGTDYARQILDYERNLDKFFMKDLQKHTLYYFNKSNNSFVPCSDGLKVQ